MPRRVCEDRAEFPGGPIAYGNGRTSTTHPLTAPQQILTSIMSRSSSTTLSETSKSTGALIKLSKSALPLGRDTMMSTANGPAIRVGQPSASLASVSCCFAAHPAASCYAA